jgi:hypothetical protein
MPVDERRAFFTDDRGEAPRHSGIRGGRMEASSRIFIEAVEDARPAFNPVDTDAVLLCKLGRATLSESHDRDVVATADEFLCERLDVPLGPADHRRIPARDHHDSQVIAHATSELEVVRIVSRPLARR